MRLISLIILVFWGGIIGGCSTSSKNTENEKIENAQNIDSDHSKKEPETTAPNQNHELKSEEIEEPSEKKGDVSVFDDFDDEYSAKDSHQSKVFDPFEGYNRAIFDFNNFFYKYAARPVAVGYAFIFPEFFRVGISKILKNLLFPLRFVNNVLQLKFEGAAVETGRFVVNTTAGIGGFFDPAKHWLDWQAREEDFGQTLGHYGIGEGFPFMIPFIGLSNVRDGVMLLPEFYFHPFTHIWNSNVYLATAVYNNLNTVSLHYREIDRFTEGAIDPYVFMRDSLRQNREQQIQE